MMDEKKPARDWPEKLLTWFDGHKRDLPWREDKPRNPYHVWISEIMLQQTRTEAVKPYFNSWMERFPTIHDLAEAEEAEVLHQWQGLGYYSRARNIHKAAREMEETYGSRLPDDKAAILALPGIGSYTAGAILSMAYGKKEGAIDGNVLRVYARLYQVEEDILKSRGRKEIESLVEATLPDRAGDFNEALMDLGADVCIPKNPRCSLCPLAGECVAFRNGKEKDLPRRSAKKPPKEEAAACGLCIREGRVLLHKRPSKGMLASMWEFPMALAEKEEDAKKGLEQLLCGTTEDCLWTYKHVFTHRIWHMKAYPVREGAVPEGEYRWFSPEEYREIPLAGPHARLAAFVEKIVY
ncbi:A/G-specific adenine glycosylase [uncultured Dialister sp.]|uniref:A/G-specific adenine glycosylase n=1 Tax=uncultured Dialister sp. TaxID=278064 RepID=UPI0026755C1F|nr:A/G-specific adenine glycosylase [uncultured Dialister sp.]